MAKRGPKSCSRCGKPGHNVRGCVVERVMLKIGPAYSPPPPPLNGVRVEASVRLDVAEMRRHLAPEQIAAVMNGIGRCLSVSSEPVSGDAQRGEA